MKGEKWIAAGLALLSIAIVFSAFWVAGAIRAAQDEPQLAVSEDLLTFEQACAYLDITPDALMKLTDNAANGDGQGIPFSRRDGRLRFSRTALAQWLIVSMQQHLSY